MHKVILDTDPGIDDAQAIAFALAHPEIELLGLTTVFGNATVDITTRNALTLLEIFGHPSTPVAKGSAQPLAQDRYPSPDFVHGLDALGNMHLAAPTTKAITESAAEFIVRKATEAAGEVSLVAIGPLTNLALALQLDNTLPEKVKELVIMGGTVAEPGNVTPLAEANFFCDPHAADQVLSRDWSTRIIGLDVTHKTPLYDSDLRKIREQTGDLGAFLWDSSRLYFDFYRRDQHLEKEEESHAPMHDASAIVALVQTDAFDYVHGGARVISSGIASGQLTLDRKGNDYLLPHWENRPFIKVAMQVDADQVRKTFVNTLLASGKSSAAITF
jgi:inosine-uridine nucleoside N-ribohydrolase